MTLHVFVSDYKNQFRCSPNMCVFSILIGHKVIDMWGTVASVGALQLPQQLWVGSCHSEGSKASLASWWLGLPF